MTDEEKLKKFSEWLAKPNQRLVLDSKLYNGFIRDALDMVFLAGFDKAYELAEKEFKMENEQAKNIITLCRDTLKENSYDFTKAYKQAEQFLKE